MFAIDRVIRRKNNIGLIIYHRFIVGNLFSVKLCVIPGIRVSVIIPNQLSFKGQLIPPRNKICLKTGKIITAEKILEHFHAAQPDQFNILNFVPCRRKYSKSEYRKDVAYLTVLQSTFPSSHQIVLAIVSSI